MPYELWWTFGLLAWVAMFLAARLVRLHIRGRERIIVRELLHRERMSAIEHSLPLPEIPLEEKALDQPRSDPATMARLAIMLIGAGIGITAGFYFAPNAEIHEIWSLGFVPIMMGLACATAAWMTRT
ncbi:MAG: DUF6249 domain-containing protein [Thermoanaerobaculia bacterium]